MKKLLATSWSFGALLIIPYSPFPAPYSLYIKREKPKSMNKAFLPPDDLPPVQLTPHDKFMRVEFERGIGRCFYQACDQITQALLSNCQWYVTLNANLVTLIIDCPDIVAYWHIVSNIPQLGNHLQRISPEAKIRVYPPTGKGMPFEISVNEISAYRDWL